ncbi:MAG: hypothetical protein KME13_25605 [Myxacorys californica WJT36-NPBG1]|nr:hypothetical protein [Myxacorys californica WJT36-NPBG1]
MLVPLAILSMRSLVLEDNGWDMLRDTSGAGNSVNAIASPGGQWVGYVAGY